MGLLGDIAAYIDSRKRVAARNVSDLASNPRGLLNMWGSQVKEDLTNNMQQMGAGVTDRAALGQSISAALGPASNAPMGMLGHTVYHGSPHKFDKFDASKIGTGEGAQAYGHGLYLAESPDVAKAYQSQLANDELFVGGRKVGEVGALTTPEAYAALMVQTSKDAAEAKAAVDKYGLSSYWVKGKADAIKKKIDEISGIGVERRRGGSLYKVDLPDEWLPKMLDWDKPLSKQSKEVQRAIMNLPTAHKLQPEMTGAQFLESMHLVPGKYSDKVAAADELRNLGIPGIRYLDGGSRGAGDGTYNYVVFPGMEGLLKILERQ